MDSIEFTRIESVKGAMPAGIGGIVRYSIEMISRPELADRLGDLSVKQAMLLDINVLAGQGLEQGEFISSAVVGDDDYERTTVAVAGTYAMEPDYNLFRRIALYRHNHSSVEDLTREDFTEVYGPAFGDHFYDKWMWLERNVAALIAYFSADTDNGQQFIGLLMRRVRQYEKRTREERR